MWALRGCPTLFPLASALLREWAWSSPPVVVRTESTIAPKSRDFRVQRQGTCLHTSHSHGHRAVHHLSLPTWGS